jgi:hypothetical protein
MQVESAEAEVAIEPHQGEAVAAPDQNSVLGIWLVAP